MTTKKLNLTAAEATLVERYNSELFPLVVAATNEEGFYLSKGGERMYPVIIDERRVEVVNADSPSESATFLESRVNDYSFDINNTILPEDLSRKGDGKQEFFWTAKKTSGFALLEKNGQMYAHKMVHICSGSSYDLWQEAFADIFLGKGIKVNSNEIPADAFKMEGDVFLDLYGHPVGKDAGLVVLYGERNGNRVLRYRCSDGSLKKPVPGKKSPLFPKINSVFNDVVILAKPVFTTANGLTICDPIKILRQS